MLVRRRLALAEPSLIPAAPLLASLEDHRPSQPQQRLGADLIRPPLGSLAAAAAEALAPETHPTLAVPVAQPQGITRFSLSPPQQPLAQSVPLGPLVAQCRRGLVTGSRVLLEPVAALALPPEETAARAETDLSPAGREVVAARH